MYQIRHVSVRLINEPFTAVQGAFLHSSNSVGDSLIVAPRLPGV